MKTTLEKAKELLESPPAKRSDKTTERAAGVALVEIARQIGRVASNLELVATNLQALTVEAAERKHK